MTRYICDVCGCNMEKPKSITMTMPTIFENLTVAFSDELCKKCEESDNDVSWTIERWFAEKKESLLGLAQR